MTQLSRRGPGRPKTPGLTQAEKRCLQAWRTAKKKDGGAPPTLDAVAAELNNSKQYADALLSRLVAKGRMTKNGRVRAYRIAA